VQGALLFKSSMPLSPAIGLPAPGWQQPALAGYITIFLSFGIIGAWSAIATMDRAVEGSGVVSVESGDKVVSHLEGGIVEQILIKEGQHVDKDQVLFRLSPVQAKARFDLVRNQLDVDLIAEARLIAERDRLQTIHWPQPILSHANEPLIARAIADEAAEFNDRRASMQGQIDVLNAEIQQVETEIEGVMVEKSANEEQVEYIKYELVGLRELLDKKLVPLDQVVSLEREQARLEGLIGMSITDREKAEALIAGTRLQIAQLQEKFEEDTAAALLDVRQKIADLRQREIVAKDIFDRLDIRAPQAGQVQALRVTTIGQTIRSGEPLADIVPDNSNLIIRAHFAPYEIDSVHQGQKAEIRFPAFEQRTIPVIMGQLQTVSTDRLVDGTSQQPYYLGLIAVSKIDIPSEIKARLRAGMPADVIVATGSRPVFSFITGPLKNLLRKAFIER
jgi:HlyD family secretion protein